MAARPDRVPLVSGGSWGGRPVPFPTSAVLPVRRAPRPAEAAPVVIPRGPASAVERLTRGRRTAVDEVLRRAPVAGRVVAVVGAAGSGRSTVAAQLAVAAASYQPGPVVVVDASGAVWPGAVCRIPGPAGGALDWTGLRRVPAKQDRIPVLSGFVHRARHAEFFGAGTGSRGWVTRVGGVSAARPWEPVGPAEVLDAVEALRAVSRMVVVDCPADTGPVARVCAVVADVLVVVCRADAGEVRRCGRLVELLAGDARRDLTGRSVIVAVQHRPGRWPRAAAVAESAAGRAVAAVLRMPFDRALVDSTAPVVRSGLGAERVAATAFLLSAQQL
ncbi:hypothetical protein ACQPZF_10565 [Actinosynnema sp. CS-041913]|uniref:hypothetical protein n=1 Tax=Actinosynnema sp. CS-041913 TaxID=3239917 RepID=UPI003D8FF9E7